MIDQAIGELAPIVGVKAACQAVGRARGSHYRQHRKRPPPPKPERVATPQPRTLSEVERKEVLRVLHHPEHVDEAPATVYAKLLDQGVFLASTSTMYRILRAQGEVAERRRQATHPPATRPELLATRPNQVWSWDIERHEAPFDRAVVKGHRFQPVAAGWGSWGQPEPRDVGEGGKQP
jgi:putative transposase